MRSHTLKGMAQHFLELIYPQKCILCGGDVSASEKFSRYLCADCESRTSQTDSPTCPVCGKIIPDLRLFDGDHCICCDSPENKVTGFIALGPYQDGGQLQKLIFSMKHGGKTFCGRELGILLGKKLQREVSMEAWHGVAAVPLHFTRKWRRGYNQAAIVARYLARSLSIPYYDWLLQRIHRTHPQRGGKIERAINIQNAFQTGGSCRGAHLILVDDVFTTGATTMECARMLVQAGAAGVFIATCAWVPKRHEVK